MVNRTGLYIGTSGWSYPKGEGTWNGYFYPKGKVVELEFYSRFFNTVELNSSFYRPPNPEYADNWVRRTPDDFLFTVKLWQKFTHPKMYKEATGQEAVISEEDVAVFYRGIEPLIRAGKLGALLAQFPPSFKNDARGQQIIRAVAGVFGKYGLALELRHRSWSDDTATAKLLAENDIAWVDIDEPKFSTSIARELPITSDMTYFRFHGRNADMWWKGDNETRYQYLYSPDEIAQLADRVKAAGDQSQLVFAQFNNHWQGYAPRNALDLKKQLGLPAGEYPTQTAIQETGNSE